MIFAIPNLRVCCFSTLVRDHILKIPGERWMLPGCIFLQEFFRKNWLVPRSTESKSRICFQCLGLQNSRCSANESKGCFPQAAVRKVNRRRCWEGAHAGYRKACLPHGTCYALDLQVFLSHPVTRNPQPSSPGHSGCETCTMPSFTLNIKNILLFFLSFFPEKEWVLLFSI